MPKLLLLAVGILSQLPETTQAFQSAYPTRPVTLTAKQARISNNVPSTNSKLFVHVSQRRLILQSTKTGEVDVSEKRVLVTKTRKLIVALFRILMTPLRYLRAPTEVSGTTQVSEQPSVVAEQPQTVVESVSVEATPVSTIEPAEMEVKEAAPAAAAVATKRRTSNRATTKVKPKAARWATASVDLSGDWKMIESEEFKQQYDEYLKRLGQPMIVRGVALGIIGLTTEYTKQKDEGRTLLIRGINARGIWERSLISSGADGSVVDYAPLEIDVVTADAETVKAEAWWEDNGTVHVSWMRGVSKYGGGDFLSRRYLKQGGKVLVCETIFHPNDETREKAHITWNFLRKGAKL